MHIAFFAVRDVSDPHPDKSVTVDGPALAAEVEAGGSLRTMVLFATEGGDPTEFDIEFRVVDGDANLANSAKMHVKTGPMKTGSPSGWIGFDQKLRGRYELQAWTGGKQYGSIAVEVIAPPKTTTAR